jgi:SAM-dependent MidA family methyltransferase
VKGHELTRTSSLAGHCGLKDCVPESSELVQVIRDEIARLGPISCERFIELALYHPRLGYYSQERLRVGRKGDFITNVSVGGLFGEILADQVVELWELLDRPPEFTIVEAGAETGELASDLLNRLSLVESAVTWSYVIAEPDELKQVQQRQRLTGRKVRWAKRLDELGLITGIILGNELLDAIPARVVEFSEDQWREVCVTLEDNSFKCSLRPINDPRLTARIAKIPLPLPQPYRTEVNLAATDWINDAAKTLWRGFVLMIDYGYSRSDYYSPLRTEGTLTAYRNQQRHENIFEEIGETDITAHVDFTATAEAGLEAGCQLIGFADQHHFMVGAGENRMRSFEETEDRKLRDQFLRAYKTLMHPEMMGLAFKYLLMGKDVPRTAKPSGFRHAGDPKKELGL